MYVLRRTVGTSISITATDAAMLVRLVGIDMLGVCALLEVSTNGSPPVQMEIGPGERVELRSDVQMELLRLGYATHEGTPLRNAEFGFNAPRSTVAIKRTECP